MSSDARQPGVPSKSELGERVARVEEQVDHIAETVDRIEDDITGNQADLAETVEKNEHRARRFWTIYRFFIYALPLVVGTGGVLSYLALF